MDFFFTRPVPTPQKVQETGEECQAEVDGGRSSHESVDDLQIQDTSSAINNISKQVQLLVEKINDRRASDQEIIENFNTKLVEEVTKTCQLMKDNMYAIYEANSNDMQLKLQELGEVLERCNALNDELMDAMKALGSLRSDLAMKQTPEQTE